MHADSAMIDLAVFFYRGKLIQPDDGESVDGPDKLFGGSQTITSGTYADANYQLPTSSVSFKDSGTFFGRSLKQPMASIIMSLRHADFRRKSFVNLYQGHPDVRAHFEEQMGILHLRGSQTYHTANIHDYLKVTMDTVIAKRRNNQLRYYIVGMDNSVYWCGLEG
ncbi:hypothetical protein LTR56_012994 [Elasticomyces elasticus]|nr:hypothetical protein LTR56_012994 [Elasticomyces elasticus]KAK3649278.1 hypothetical protein LTR22_013007 [Elasticomyces elasticus]KAK4928188.1 hypothetical protein LTR49_005126 [Elasticomyces elasticus]KAK5765942.1 hypothetical protein LTS12_003949 [Elasticomyces elasticus]